MSKCKYFESNKGFLDAKTARRIRKRDSSSVTMTGRFVYVDDGFTVCGDSRIWNQELEYRCAQKLKEKYKGE